MPLIVHHGTTSLCSWDYDDLDRWQALREDRRYVAGLRFDCCDSPVVLKVSVNDMPFFAHAPGQACAEWERTAHRESVEHQAAKYAVALYLSRLPGWTVRTEAPGPDGSWRADVLATHDGGRRIAVEPQLSRQPADQFYRRSRRYLDAGILPAWITTGLPAEVDMRSVAHFRVRDRSSLRCDAATLLRREGWTTQWDVSEKLPLADYLDRLADPDMDWPWQLEPRRRLRVGPEPEPSRSPAVWPPRGPTPANEAERLKAMYARLGEAAQSDQAQSGVQQSGVRVPVSVSLRNG